MIDLRVSVAPVSPNQSGSQLDDEVRDITFVIEIPQFQRRTAGKSGATCSWISWYKGERAAPVWISSSQASFRRFNSLVELISSIHSFRTLSCTRTQSFFHTSILLPSILLRIQNCFFTHIHNGQLLPKNLSPCSILL